MMEFEVRLSLFICKFDTRYHSRRIGGGEEREREREKVGTACTFSTKMNTLLSCLLV